MLISLVISIGLFVSSLAAAIYFFKHKKKKLVVITLLLMLVVFFRLVYLGFTISYLEKQAQRQDNRNNYTTIESNISEGNNDLKNGNTKNAQQTTSLKDSSLENNKTINDDVNGTQPSVVLPQVEFEKDESVLGYGLDSVLERTKDGEARVRHDYSKITDKMVDDFLYGEVSEIDFFKIMNDIFSNDQDEKTEQQQRGEDKQQAEYQEELKESIANSLRKNRRNKE